MSEEIKINGLDFSVSEAPADDNGVNGKNEALTFEFSVGMPKTALVFEDSEEDSTPEISSEEITAPVIEEKKEEADTVEEAAPVEREPIRTAEDDEFILPDEFGLMGEETVPFSEAEPLIWTTPVLGFTEASEKRYKFIDEEEAKRREQIKRAKIDRSAGRAVSDFAPAEEPVRRKAVEKNVTAEEVHSTVAVETTAEIDNSDALKEAVVVNINGAPQDNPDAINVFKFDEEKAPVEETPVLSEEEIEREKISTLVNCKIEEPEIEETEEVSVTDNGETEEVAPAEAVRREIPHPASPFKEVYSASSEEELPENERPEGYNNKLDVSSDGGSEYTYFTQREKFKDKFLDMLMSVRLRAIVSTVLALILLAFETLPLFMEDFYSTIGLQNSVAVGGVDVLLIAGLFAFAIPEIIRALDNLRRGCVVPEISLILSAAVIAVYTVVSSFGGSYPVLLGSVYSVTVLSAIFATYNNVCANFTAFKNVSEKGVKRVVDVRHTRNLVRENIALDGAIDESKSEIARDFKTSFVADFIKNSGKKRENHKGNLLILSLTYGIALVLGVVMFFIGDGVESLLSSFAIVVCIAIPAFSILSHKMPYNHGQSELFRVSASVIGEEAFYDADGVNVVAFEDTEIFGADDVAFKSISLSHKDGDFRRAMKMMSQLFGALGGPLSVMFEKSLGKHFDPAKKIVIENDGVQGVIDGVTVMAGSAEYMRRKGISVPVETGFVPASLKTMYAAEGGVMFAKFSIQYSFSEDFAHMLSAMRERNIIPLVYTRDPNVNNELLHFLTGAKDCIRVMKKNTVAPREEKIYPALSTRLVVRGEKIDTVNLLLVAKKYSKLQSGIALTELAASLVGAILACLIVICSLTPALSSALLAIWHVAWCVALFFMSRSSFKSYKKRKK